MSIYACSDLHGMGNLWDKIKNFLKPEDRLYFLGDAIDRGPDGYRIMKEMLADPRITYILGNHELMMYNACIDEENDSASALWIYWNGGLSTYEAWVNDGRPQKVLQDINNLPLYWVYRNKEDIDIILTHAGFTPGMMPKERKKFVWDRDHITSGPYVMPNECDPCLVVHGHTPCESLEEILENNTLGVESNNPNKYLYQEDSGIIWYWNCQKVCIDVGSVWNGYTVLFNLDTYDTVKIMED